MPTERFLRLPDHKKEAIQNAAIEEFARVPFEKASINKIIQHANISRGSFYTYFEDKQDILNFIFDRVHQKANEFFEQNLTETGGDYFGTWELFLDFCLSMFENKKFFDLAKNTQPCFRGEQAFFGPPDGLEKARWDENKKFSRLVDMSRLRIADIEAFGVLNSLLLSNLAVALVTFYQGDKNLNNLKKRYLIGIEMIKRGALSDETDRS